jgi:hypothetical protein
VEYSNLGYGILGYVVSRVSGKAFADYMRQDVFLKLGMTRTSVGISPEMADFEAVRYGEDGLPISPYLTDHAGASEVYSSAHDLVRFGMFHLKDHLADQVAILPDSLIEGMQKPTARIGEQEGYGIGWDISSRAGYTIVSHTGGMPGVETELRLVPSEKLATAVLCNAEDYPLAGNVTDEIMKIMLAHWKVPDPEPSSPNHEFVPPRDLVGTWKGTVLTYESAIPLTLHVQESGDVHVELGNDLNLKTLLNFPHYSAGGFLTGVFNGNIRIKDANRRPYWLTLHLKLRNGNVLNGAIRARADLRGVMPTSEIFPFIFGQDRPTRIQTEAFVLSQWAELSKQ